MFFRSAGSYGSRLTGAGWGGCVVSLVAEDHTEEFLETVAKTYYNVCPDAVSQELFFTFPGRAAGFVDIPRKWDWLSIFSHFLLSVQTKNSTLDRFATFFPVRLWLVLKVHYLPSCSHLFFPRFTNHFKSSWGSFWHSHWGNWLTYLADDLTFCTSVELVFWINYTKGDTKSTYFLTEP